MNKKVRRGVKDTSKKIIQKIQKKSIQSWIILDI